MLVILLLKKQGGGTFVGTPKGIIFFIDTGIKIKRKIIILKKKNIMREKDRGKGERNLQKVFYFFTRTPLFSFAPDTLDIES